MGGKPGILACRKVVEVKPFGGRVSEGPLLLLSRCKTKGHRAETCVDGGGEKP